MRTTGQLVTQLPNQGWDTRLHVCRYQLAYDDYALTMHVFIVISRRFVVIVDTLVNAPTAAELLEIARPHLPGRQLLVINTHADYDHAWGNQLFDGPDCRSPAPIIGTRQCAQRMRSQTELDQLARLREEQPEVYQDVHLTPPTLLFDEALTLDGGDLTLRLCATPGHTPDHCSLYIPEIRTLLAGDAAELPFPWIGVGGLADLRASLQRLTRLCASDAFYCHAPVDTGPGLLTSNIDYFDRLEACCRQALGASDTLDAVHDDDLGRVVGFSYEDALPPGAESWANPRFYRPCHAASIRAMLACLGGKS